MSNIYGLSVCVSMNMANKGLYWLLLLLLCICYSCQTCAGQDLSKLRELQERLSSLAPGAEGVDRDNLVQNVTKAVELFERYWRYEFPAKVRAGQVPISEGCQKEYETFWNTKGDFGLPLGIFLFDATGKPGAGYFYGNSYAYGSYDECFDIDNTQYCLAPATIVLTVPFTVPFSLPLTFARFGFCIPSNCTAADLQAAVATASIFTNATETMCDTEKWVPYNAGAIVMIAVCCLFALLVFIGTFMDWIMNVCENLDEGVHNVLNRDAEQQDRDWSERMPLLEGSRAQENPQKKKKTSPLDFITAFSLYKVLPTVLATKQPPSAIGSINGMRVISLFWVILCHTHLWVIIETGADNPRHVIEDVLPRFTFQAIANGFFSVDSFFFLSGLLVSYLTLREMGRKKGRFPFLTYYLHRYLRLTPTYAFLLFFYWFLSMHLADGPLYQSATGVHSGAYKMCEKYWWTNFLYINNLYPWKLGDECMGWTWYLSNDMQFFVVAPLMVILLFFSPILGFISSGMFLIASFITTGVIAGHYKYDANTFLPAVEAYYAAITNSTAPHQPSHGYNDEIYIKPYARISPYIVGIVLGYLLYKKVRIPFSKLLNWPIYLVLWLLAAFLCFSTVYGFYGTYHDHSSYSFSVAENVMYITFSRFAWALGLALIVFACHNGYGGAVDKFLSMKFWIPLSRLTFTAYLIHPIILTVIFGSARNTVHYGDINMAVYAVGTVVLSYGAAGAVAVFVEFPLANVEATLFKLLGLGVRESARQGTSANGDRNQLTLSQELWRSPLKNSKN